MPSTDLLPYSLIRTQVACVLGHLVSWKGTSSTAESSPNTVTDTLLHLEGGLENQKKTKAKLKPRVALGPYFSLLPPLPSLAEDRREGRMWLKEEGDRNRPPGFIN